MTQLHLWLAYITLAAAILLLAAAALGVGAPQRLRAWLDRAILVVLAILAIAALTGLPLIVLAGGPADPLHFLYALVAPLLVGGARYLGHDVDLRRRSLYMAAAGIALLGVVYRLFTTG